MLYVEKVRQDIENNQDDYNYIFEESENMDDLRESLYDSMWTDDNITGNGSGSYTFNRTEAREHVLEDMDTVLEAINEFCVSAETIGKKFMQEDWEWIDVTARCFVLGQALDEFIEDNKEDIEKAFAERGL